LSEEALERIYTINLGKVLLSSNNHRAKRAINMIREFAIKHMKSETVKIEEDVSHLVWKRGIRHPPRKIRVKISKDDDGNIIVSKYQEETKAGEEKPKKGEKKAEEKPKKEEKKEEKKIVEEKPKPEEKKAEKPEEKKVEEKPKKEEKKAEEKPKAKKEEKKVEEKPKKEEKKPSETKSEKKSQE